MAQYDYLLVGGGLFSGVFAQQAKKQNKSCLVVEKRENLGGNIYCKNIDGVNVHWYGAHIFHTSNKKVWDYVTSLTEFNRYTNSPIANYKGELYNLPFNMNTFNKMWGVVTPEEAHAKIQEQRDEVAGEPSNLEEQAIRLVGKDIYYKLIKGYTEKQWARDCKELPSFIIKRLPVRYTYDNNYFNDLYQGIPIKGYNDLVERLFEGCDIKLQTDYLEDRHKFTGMADKVVYTGMIDAYFDYQYGELEYRSLHFEHETLEKENYQGVAVMNYTDRETPFTRIIEHKHFEYGKQPKTVITKEYPVTWEKGMEPYYPVNNDRNQTLYKKYAQLAENETNVVFGGRLAEYKYYDMDAVIYSALQTAKRELAK